MSPGIFGSRGFFIIQNMQKPVYIKEKRDLTLY